MCYDFGNLFVITCYALDRFLVEVISYTQSHDSLGSTLSSAIPHRIKVPRDSWSATMVSFNVASRIQGIVISLQNLKHTGVTASIAEESINNGNADTVNGVQHPQLLFFVGIKLQELAPISNLLFVNAPRDQWYTVHERPGSEIYDSGRIKDRRCERRQDIWVLRFNFVCAKTVRVCVFSSLHPLRKNCARVCGLN